MVAVGVEINGPRTYEDSKHDHLYCAVQEWLVSWLLCEKLSGYLFTRDEAERNILYVA